MTYLNLHNSTLLNNNYKPLTTKNITSRVEKIKISDIKYKVIF